MKKTTGKLHVRVADLMQEQVTTTALGETVSQVRALMREKRISCLPVADPEGKPVGIVTSTDLLELGAEDRPVSAVMAAKVHTVPLYAEIADAARTMRKNHIHHVVVVHEKKIVGVLSSFDVLRLIEDRAFTSKRPPTRPKHRRRSGGRRDTDIHGHTE